MSKTSMQTHCGLTSFVVGDPHFKANDILQGADFIERVVSAAKARNPSFIVILGDVLDTHEVVRVSPHKLAERLFEAMADIAPTYVLIGNHDLINQSQFLTDEHIFNPMKMCPNLYIVDKPLAIEIADPAGVSEERTFVFCPYVPPGRFVEALNTLITQGSMWDIADGIFAHQEFRGCQMGAITSEDGDMWDEAYPPVISGHIHDAQTVGTNIFYTGSAIQHAFGESPSKRVWFMNWNPDESTDSADSTDSVGGSADYTEQGFSVEKIDLGMKSKKMISMTVNELMGKETSKKFLEMLKRCHLKIALSGLSEEFKKFRRSHFSTTLKKLGVKFSYKLTPTGSADVDGLATATRKDVSYREVLREVVAEKDVLVQNEYHALFGEGSAAVSSVASGLVFIDDDEDVNDNDEVCQDCELALDECCCKCELCELCGQPEDGCCCSTE